MATVDAGENKNTTDSFKSGARFSGKAAGLTKTGPDTKAVVIPREV
jgi:hypothetical protein